MPHQDFLLDRSGMSLDDCLDEITTINDNFRNGSYQVTDIIILTDPEDKPISWIRSKNDNCIFFRLVRAYNGSLILNGELRNVDKTPYEGMGRLEFMAGNSVREEGYRLIEKYGLPDEEFNLKERFVREFLNPTVNGEDHGIYYGLMLKFFLRNLPNLRHPGAEENRAEEE